jgi:CheY-specific phosphatase CheX
MSVQTAQGLASSFLGREPESLDAADCTGVAGELANMICGSVLSHYAEESEFRLAAPVLQQGVLPYTADEHSACASLELPEGALDVYVRVDRP